ncbi:dUTP diphosphatase [Niallia sp. NCCP-28]|uniref:dUTP diphosphatase n=1 Tax=Niallia sp. NCCP-28 TaxID=2934712 RepID=UPI0020BDC3AB|nr:dUTP diphosphatase [Niallia sp. NCCP-28]
MNDKVTMYLPLNIQKSGGDKEMNLTKLFEAQKVFIDKMEYADKDCFEELILGLFVKLGKCANEWQGFKFWNENQMPNNKISGLDDKGNLIFKNPLLEEYVDGLAFAVRIGIVKEVENITYSPFKNDSIVSQFVYINRVVTTIFTADKLDYWHYAYRHLIGLYLGLGAMLGFTGEQIEKAYYVRMESND